MPVLMALIIRVKWKAYSMNSNPCMFLPMWRLSWGRQETMSQPMVRYIAQALSFESEDTRRTTGSPKSRNRTTFTRQAANLWKVKERLWQELLADTPHDRVVPAAGE